MLALTLNPKPQILNLEYTIYRFNPYMSAVWYNLGTLYESCKQPPDAKDAYHVPKPET